MHCVYCFKELDPLVELILLGFQTVQLAYKLIVTEDLNLNLVLI